MGRYVAKTVAMRGGHPGGTWVFSFGTKVRKRGCGHGKVGGVYWWFGGGDQARKSNWYKKCPVSGLGRREGHAGGGGLRGGR